MDRELLEKANELNDQIKKLESHIGAINRIIRIGEQKEENYIKNKYFAKIRFLNLKRNEDEPKKASVILFNCVDVCGYTDIDVDEEFLNYLSKYFENKKEELEKEFKKLGK